MDEARRVIEAQAAARIAEAGVVEGGWTEPLDGMVLVSLGFSEFWSNVALALWPVEKPARALERAAERLAPHPLCVQVVADATPSVEKAALSRGMVAFEGFYALSRDASGLVVPVPAEYAIERVTDERSLREYIAAQSEGFGDDLAMNSARHPAAILNDDRTRLLLARGSAGAAVATARVFIDAGAAGVSGVTTLPAHRGRGIASALVAQAMRLGTDAGADLGWLGAGDDVAPLYERLGFKRVAQLRMFTPAP